MKLKIDNSTIEINDIYDLYQIGTRYPTYISKLIDYLLSNPRKFNQIVKNQVQFCDVLFWLPNYKKKLIDFLLENSIVFKQIVRSALSLHEFLKYFSNYTDTMLQYLLKNIDQVERILYCDYDLMLLRVNFPNCAELRKSSIAEVLTELKVKNYAKVLNEESKLSSSYFSFLPIPLKTRIAILSGAPSLQHISLAKKTAEEVICSLSLPSAAKL